MSGMDSVILAIICRYRHLADAWCDTRARCPGI